METWLKMRFAPLFWTGAMHLGEHDNGIFYVMIMMMRMMMIMMMRRMMMIMRMMAMVMIMRRRGRATNQTKKAHLARR